MSFDEAGTTADGRQPEQVAELLATFQADAIGVNCATGPAGVFEMVTRMRAPGLPLVAIPNAGMPQKIEGRFAYMATPEYFQLYARRLFKAGVHGVGGCCGTTPEHIRKIVAAARMISAGHGHQTLEAQWRRHARGPGPATAQVAPGVQVVATRDKGPIGAKLGQKFLVSVEVNPPPGLSIESGSQRRTRPQATAASTSSTWPTAHALRRAWATWRCACASRKRWACPRSCTSRRATATCSARSRYLLARPRARRAQPGGHHRRSAEDGRFPRRDRRLRH